MTDLNHRRRILCNAILDDPVITRSHCPIVHHLLYNFFDRKKERCLRRMEQIAHKANVDVRTVRRAIRGLQEQGYIRVEKGGGRGRANAIYFIWIRPDKGKENPDKRRTNLSQNADNPVRPAYYKENNQRKNQGHKPPMDLHFVANGSPGFDAWNRLLQGMGIGSLACIAEAKRQEEQTGFLVPFDFPPQQDDVSRLVKVERWLAERQKISNQNQSEDI